MAENTFYVRNGRPNRLILKVAGLRKMLEARGARADSTALPEEAREDANITRLLASGFLEEISKDDFMHLGIRNDDAGQLRAERFAEQVAVPLSTPTDSNLRIEISNEDLDKTKELRSPSLEFAEDPISTEEEVELLKEGHPTGPKPKSAKGRTRKRVQSAPKKVKANSE